MWARRQITCSFFLFPVLFLAGCRNCDLVEAELRSRESDLRELRADLARAEGENEALMHEVGALRQGTSSKITPELASQTYTLKQVVLGRGTGGYDEDNCPGDEALQVVLEPRDSDGHSIKAPGALHVEAQEITPEGLKIPLSSWEIPPHQLRRSWRSGLLSTGYVVVLPWQNWPSSEKIRVIARFTLADGRVFEADKDVTIRLAPAAYRKTAPLPHPLDGPGPVLPEPDETLPPPRKVPRSGDRGTTGDAIPSAKASPLWHGLTPWWHGLRTVPQSGDSGTTGDAIPSSKAWWLLPPGGAEPVERASMWHANPSPSIADSIQLLRPTALTHEPGENSDE